MFSLLFLHNIPPGPKSLTPNWTQKLAALYNTTFWTLFVCGIIQKVFCVFHLFKFAYVTFTVFGMLITQTNKQIWLIFGHCIRWCNRSLRKSSSAQGHKGVTKSAVVDLVSVVLRDKINSDITLLPSPKGLLINAVRIALYSTLYGN